MTEACTLSNQAALLIEKNDYEQAIGLLQQSLVLTRTTMMAFDVVNNSRSEAQHPHGQTYSCRFLTPRERSSSGSCFLQAVRLVSSSEQTHEKQHQSCSYPSRHQDRPQQRNSMFGSPLLLSLPVVELADQRSLERVSYVLVYNLALAHHLMAMQREEDGYTASKYVRQYRQKALALYEKAHCLLSRICVDNGESLSMLHPLAIFCNLGHLHHDMGTKSHAVECYQNLLTAICFIVDGRGGGGSRRRPSSSVQDDDSVLTPELIDGFLDNIMQILQKKGSVAAAA